MLKTTAESEEIQPFEYEFTLFFIQTCVQTTFPDHRQRFMRMLLNFFKRLRTIYGKDFLKWKKTQAAFDYEKSPEVVPEQFAALYRFLSQVCTHAQNNLYMDKPIEGSFPLFEVIRVVQDLFGGIKYHLNKTKIFIPLDLLQHANLLQSKSLCQFLLNSFKSTWTAVRLNAFNLLTSYSDNYVLFKDASFVND